MLLLEGKKRFVRNSAIVNIRLFLLIIDPFLYFSVLFLFSLPLSNFLTAPIFIVGKGLFIVGVFLASDVKKPEGAAD